MQPPNYKTLYEKHRPAALAIPEAEIQICRADPRVAFVNIKVGYKHMLGTPELVATAAAHLPMIPMADLLDLTDLGRALVFASGKVIGRVASPREIDAKLAFIREPREQMLGLAEVLAKRGKLDKDRVAKVRAGSGKYDSAHDVVTLVDMFTEDAPALAGLHPFTAEELDQYREAGEWLLENLTPDGAKAEVTKKQKPAADAVRDGLWTMIVQRHAHLRKLGFYFYADEVDAYVPRLQSRVPPTALAEEEPEAEQPEGEGETDGEAEADAKPKADAKAETDAKPKPKPKADEKP